MKSLKYYTIIHNVGKIAPQFTENSRAKVSNLNYSLEQVQCPLQVFDQTLIKQENAATSEHISQGEAYKTEFKLVQGERGLKY